VDGLPSKESQILLKKLSALLAEKWGKPSWEICGYVNAQMLGIAIVHAYSVLGCLKLTDDHLAGAISYPEGIISRACNTSSTSFWHAGPYRFGC
jgi:hypothetical protein